MIAQLRAELLKQRSTRTSLGLFAAMLALVVLFELLHAVALPAKDLGHRSDQLSVFGRGEMFGVLFAALLGAMSITGEFRHGTIRPTLLTTPRRGRVVTAKVGASMLIGTAFGLIAQSLAAALGSAAFAARGIEIRLDGGDYTLLLAGSAAAAALWAAIGVGLGAILRSQVPTVVGICVWLLLVEGLFVADVGLGSIGRYTPGALGTAISGQEPLLAPALAVILLALYAAAAAAAGWMTMTRRDVA